VRKFKCSVCGFIYDEATGLLEKGIAPGTKWEQVPDQFMCPWCGAPKAVFDEVKEQATASAPLTDDEEYIESLSELSVGELSALCSNLAKGCEKQQLTEEMDLFYQLADYYTSKVISESGKSFADVAKLLKSDLQDGYSKANAVATENADRGSLRSLVWSEKVSRMVNSLLDRYAEEGDAMLEKTKIYVCDICGFVYLGNDLPEICPVCKVPNYKMSQIGRG